MTHGLQCALSQNLAQCEFPIFIAFLAKVSFLKISVGGNILDMNILKTFWHAWLWQRQEDCTFNVFDHETSHKCLYNHSVLYVVQVSGT